MNLNTKTFDIVTVNKENAILWGQKMWFILTNVYRKNNIDKLQEHQMWLQNITLAIIYHEFTVSGLMDIDAKIDLDELFELPEFKWDKTTMAYLSAKENLGYAYFENYTISSRNALLIELIDKTKEFIFYSLINHYNTSNAVFDELIKSISDTDINKQFAQDFAWEYVRETFTLLEDF